MVGTVAPTVSSNGSGESSGGPEFPTGYSAGDVYRTPGSFSLLLPGLWMRAYMVTSVRAGFLLQPDVPHPSSIRLKSVVPGASLSSDL